MSSARLDAGNKIIAAQNRALAKAHAALKGITRNAIIADEWLVPVRTAIAEIEGRASPNNESPDRTFAGVLRVMADGLSARVKTHTNDSIGGCHAKSRKAREATTSAQRSKLSS
jgi:hypothetical protein